MDQSIDLAKLEWIKKNQHVCISPWTKADLMVGHKTPIVQPCCNLHPRKNYKPFSLEPIEETKAAMLAGYLPDECYLCKRDEDKGLQSERMRYLIPYSLEELQEFERTRELSFFAIGSKFSNLCNLGCRSCNPVSSSLWSKIYQEPATVELETDLSEMPEYWENLERICREQLDNKGNKRVTFHPKGGETMVQPGFRRVLEWFIEKGYNKKLDSIIITTNFTSLQKRVLELLDQFNQVLFDGSIDSVGKNYHYVRWPEHFTTIEKNLVTLMDLIKRNHELGYPKYIFMVTITWSLNNIWYINDVLDYWHNWMKTNNTEWIAIETINLYEPAYLAVDAVPAPYRKHLYDIIETARQHPIFDNDRQQVLKSYLYHVSNALQRDDLANEQQFITYLKKTADGDIRNNVRMKDYNKLYDLLTDEHKLILKRYYDRK